MAIQQKEKEVANAAASRIEADLIAEEKKSKTKSQRKKSKKSKK